MDNDQVARNKSTNNLKVWEKPILTPLDIKQTLVGGGSEVLPPRTDANGNPIPEQ